MTPSAPREGSPETTPTPPPQSSAPKTDLATAWQATLEERRRASTAEPSGAPEPASEPAPAPAPAVAVARRSPLRFALTFGTIAALAGGNGYVGWVAQENGERADELAAQVATLEKERAADIGARGELTRERAGLREELDGARGELERATDRARALDEAAKKASAEAQALAKERAELDRKLEQAAGEARAAEERAGELAQKTERLNAEKEALERREEQLEKEKARLFDELGETKDDLDRAAKKLDGLEKTLAAIEANGHNVERLAGKAGPPRVKATVLTVLLDAQPRSAILSAGRADKVEKGDVFYVFRGDQAIGRLEVRSVDARRAGAWIVQLETGQEIRTGDEARTYRD